jgi:hypothetical protein
MKRVIFAFGILFLFAWSKTKVLTTPPLLGVQEEAFKYSFVLNNITTGSILETDSLNFGVNISSKLPTDIYKYPKSNGVAKATIDAAYVMRLNNGYCF